VYGIQRRQSTAFRGDVRNQNHEDFDLDDVIGDGPVVLAFFPGAFTPPCTNEMVAFQESLDDFEDAGVTLLGLSVDSPFCLGAFRDEHGIEFDLVSDTGRTAIDEYGLRMDLPDLGLHGIANRAVYVLDDEGTVVYDRVADDPTNEPDYDDILDAVQTV